MNAPNRLARLLGVVTLAAIAGASLGSGAAHADRRGHWHGHRGYYHPYYAPPPPVYYAPPAPPPGLGLYFNIR